MDAIAMGCLTAFLVARGPMSRWMLWVLGVVGTALMVFSLVFSIEAYRLGLGRNGLNMTVLAAGTCCVIAVAAQMRWRSWIVLRPLLLLGQRSYEIYLTHVFVVLGLFAWFVARGKPMNVVWPMFVAAVVLAALIGEVVARIYTEPMNRWLRRLWNDDPKKLGAVVDV
jgi:peptidoglycan/LPS O-acetylase OafA/YrhL